jgi:glucuronate isomerase
MKTFMDEDFLLPTKTAQQLYHAHAARMPILDYHCHINPQEIAEDRHFTDITQLWLGGDHYKWRQMRSNGIEERYITGDAPDWEKFLMWARTLEKAVGNPLYHWSHLELKRYFGYHGVLNGTTAPKVWELCNEKLAQPSMGARGILAASHVALLCTTDDPTDDLHWHKMLAAETSAPISSPRQHGSPEGAAIPVSSPRQHSGAEEAAIPISSPRWHGNPEGTAIPIASQHSDKEGHGKISCRVLPTWRPDRALSICQEGFPGYIQSLSAAAGIPISSFRDWKEAMDRRMAYFGELGCCISDHGLRYIPYAPASPDEVERIFSSRLQGCPVSQEEERKFQTAAMLFLGESYARRGWAMQLHFGVTRDNNTKMFQSIGADTGFDGIYNQVPFAELSAYLDALCSRGTLPKTILYSLNPNDNAAIGTLIGCFQEAGTPGKIQQGSAWWFNDHKQGMVSQLTSLANLGLLGNFIGMLTDSRSFLSYPRHEYFRRILCGMLGDWAEQGECPADMDWLAQTVENICYYNAKNYFGFSRYCPHPLGAPVTVSSPF